MRRILSELRPFCARDRFSTIGATAIRATFLVDDGDDGDIASGEADLIGTDIEDVFGGAGNDVIGGNGQPNHLRGGGGNDLLNGRGAADQLHGGSGNDDVRAADSLRDTVIDCGEGVDSAVRDVNVDLPSNCEALK